MLLFFTGEGAVVGDGLVGAEVVEAVLDEVGALHAGEQEGGLFAVELGAHGLEHGVVRLGRFGRGLWGGEGVEVQGEGSGECDFEHG